MDTQDEELIPTRIEFEQSIWITTVINNLANVIFIYLLLFLFLFLILNEV